MPHRTIQVQMPTMQSEIVSICSPHSNLSCSLACFKSESHNHDNLETKDTESKAELPQGKDTQLAEILKDPELSRLLREPTLRFHLLTIYEILNGALIRETSKEGRMDVANKKLTNLRARGLEENELVEEFCCKVLELLN